MEIMVSIIVSRIISLTQLDRIAPLKLNLNPSLRREINSTCLKQVSHDVQVGLSFDPRNSWNSRRHLRGSGSYRTVHDPSLRFVTRIWKSIDRSKILIEPGIQKPRVDYYSFSAPRGVEFFNFRIGRLFPG